MEESQSAAFNTNPGLAGGISPNNASIANPGMRKQERQPNPINTDP